MILHHAVYRHPGARYWSKTPVEHRPTGDAFLGGILYHLSGLTLGEIHNLSQNEFQKIVTFANAVGALTTTKKGAIPALPDLEAVGRLMKGR